MHAVGAKRHVANVEPSAALDSQPRPSNSVVCAQVLTVPSRGEARSDGTCARPSRCIGETWGDVFGRPGIGRLGCVASEGEVRAGGKGGPGRGPRDQPDLAPAAGVDVRNLKPPHGRCRVSSGARRVIAGLDLTMPTPRHPHRHGPRDWDLQGEGRGQAHEQTGRQPPERAAWMMGCGVHWHAGCTGCRRPGRVKLGACCVVVCAHRAARTPGTVSWRVWRASRIRRWCRGRGGGGEEDDVRRHPSGGRRGRPVFGPDGELVGRDEQEETGEDERPRNERVGEG